MLELFELTSSRKKRDAEGAEELAEGAEKR
jgi:hypothetical protein